MSEKEAKQLVITSMLVTGMVAVGTKVVKKDKLPAMRILIGILVAGFLLSTLAQFAPELAGPLAMLMLITAVFASGPILKQLSKIGGK